MSPSSPSGPPVEASDQRDTFAALDDETRLVLLHIAERLQGLRFGTVLLVVQDAKVVQIELAEKHRLR